jgi:hypothetical protein
VQIRRKDAEFTAGFREESDAKLWAWYKERLLDNMSAFSPANGEMITIGDAVDLKIQSISGPSAKDLKSLFSTYPEWMGVPLTSLTSKMILEKTRQQLTEKVRRGGNPKDPSTGHLRQVSPATIAGHLRRLSSVYGYMIEQGVDILNPCAPALSEIKLIMEERNVSRET